MSYIIPTAPSSSPFKRTCIPFWFSPCCVEGVLMHLVLGGRGGVFPSIMYSRLCWSQNSWGNRSLPHRRPLELQEASLETPEQTTNQQPQTREVSNTLTAFKVLSDPKLSTPPGVGRGFKEIGGGVSFRVLLPAHLPTFYWEWINTWKKKRREKWSNYHPSDVKKKTTQ